MLIGLLHQTLQHVRFEIQLSIIGALLLAEPLANGMGTSCSSAVPVSKPSTTSMACLFTLAALLTTVRFLHPLAAEHPDSITSPVSALQHVPQELWDKPVINENAFAGYMIFKGIHPFFDSRQDLYGDTFIKNYMEMMSPNRKQLEAFIAQYHAQWAILATQTPIIGIMDTLPGWHRYYADSIAVIYVRDNFRKKN